MLHHFIGNRFRLCFMGLMLIVLSAVCWSAVSFAQPPREELKVGIETFHGFDIIKFGGFTISTAIVVNTVLEPLFYMDEKGELVPALGLSATSSADGKVWTVALRKGVLFHDGTPFTADAVTAHWSRMLDPKIKFRGRAYITSVKSVEKIDAHTVRFNLKHPWPAFKGVISWIRGIALIPSPAAMKQETGNSAPVGTGPFQFVKWKHSDYISVEKNPNYWKSIAPIADRIKFRIISDHQTRYTSLKAGETDLIYTDRGIHIRQAEKDADLNVFSALDNGADIIRMNHKSPPLDDVRVRKAVLLAWDQAKYISVSKKGTIPKIEHIFGSTLDCNNTAYNEHDPQAAKKLLAQYGKPVKIEYIHTQTPRGQELGQIMQQLMKEAGIELILTPLDMGALIRKIIKGNYQMGSGRIPSAPDQGPSLFKEYHSESKANFAKYADLEIDDFLEKQRMETNPETRKKLLCRIAAKINNDAVTMFLGGRRYHFIGAPKLDRPQHIIQGIPFFYSDLK
ncbi:ABC transporter substrate-binding protein [Desulfobacterales bacterium HSG17]|nr:ABC transporter substrate-binding protein [Desulfobacterales bacterium HSG17]